jgi:hypothetical protein
MVLLSGWWAAGIAGPVALRAQQAAPPPTVLVAVDQRQALNLDGDWHSIVDPYDNGLSGGRNGYPLDDEVPAGSNKLLEYDFAKSPVIKVPGDWNTQKEALLNYEGGFWYERHFAYEPKVGHRSFLHIGAANYRARAWVRCEGGAARREGSALDGGVSGGDLPAQYRHAEQDSATAWIYCVDF